MYVLKNFKIVLFSKNQIILKLKKTKTNLEDITKFMSFRFSNICLPLKKGSQYARNRPYPSRTMWKPNWFKGSCQLLNDNNNIKILSSGK